MPLKCVPLVPGMFGDTKLDLKAIYRRRKQDNWGTPELDANGLEQWDLTGPLPLRRHQDYVNKGFEYLTLADEQSLVDARHLVPHWEQYANQDRRTRSPFSQALYLEDVRSHDDRELVDLREMVEQFGPEAVTAIRRKTQPGFELPASLKAVKARKGTAA